MPAPLNALTVRRPWSWWIARGFKPVENREWSPPKFLLGKYLAIHAGLAWEPGAKVFHAGELELARVPFPTDEETSKGCIVAVARLAGAIEVTWDRLGEIRQVIGDIPRERAEKLVHNPWSCGPWLWVLDDVTEIKPAVPCIGRQKIWTAPRDVADQVRAAWAAARLTPTRGATT